MSTTNSPFYVVYVALIFIGIPLVGVIVLAAIASSLAKIVEKLDKRAPRTVRTSLTVAALLLVTVFEVISWRMPSMHRRAVEYLLIVVGVTVGSAARQVIDRYRRVRVQEPPRKL